MDNQEKPFPQLPQATNEDFLTLDEEQLEGVSGGIVLKTGILSQKKEFPDHIILSGDGKIASPLEAKTIIARKQNEELYASEHPTTPNHRITFEKHQGRIVPLAWKGAEPAIVDYRANPR